MDSLPLPILHIILSRLPTKTLVLLRVVCRLFRDMVDDPSFTLMHLSNVAINEPPRILRLLPSIEPDHDRLVVDDKFVSSGLGVGDGSYKLWGSCHGLVCVERFNDNVIFLLNPILRETISLLKPSTCMHNSMGSASRRGRECFHWFGIGLHPVTQKYKIVHVGWYKDRKALKAVRRAEVLDQGSRSWRKIKSFVPQYFLSVAIDPVYVHGSIHWVAENRVVSFCVADEEFVSTPLPVALHSEKEVDSLVDLGSRGWGLVEIRAESNIEIWMLNEDRHWVKEYRIDLSNVCRGYETYKFGVVGYCPYNGKIILEHQSSFSKGFCSYDSMNRVIEYLPRQFIWFNIKCNWRALNFKTSLVSPVKLWNVKSNKT